MTINTKNIVSITEANQNFSKVARLVDETGAAVILKNNVPRTWCWNSVRHSRRNKRMRKACGIFPGG